MDNTNKDCFEVRSNQYWINFGLKRTTKIKTLSRSNKSKILRKNPHYRKLLLKRFFSIKISKEFSVYFAFILMATATVQISIIFCFFKCKRYKNDPMKWLHFIANLSIELVYLMLLINHGLILEFVDFFEWIISTSETKISFEIIFII